MSRFANDPAQVVVALSLDDVDRIIYALQEARDTSITENARKSYTATIGAVLIAARPAQALRDGTPYPACETLAAHEYARSVLNDFRDWLEEEGITIVRYEDRSRYSDRISVSWGSPEKEGLIYQFLDVDAKALDPERRQMLAEAQAQYRETRLPVDLPDTLKG